MARKISFDISADETTGPTTEARDAAPKPMRPLMGLQRSIKESSALGAVSQSLSGISEKVKRAEEIEQKEVHAGFRSIVDQIPRTATTQELEPIAEELSQLADDVRNLLETHIKSQNMGASEFHTERHIQNSNPDPLIDLEPGFQEVRAARAVPEARPPTVAEATYPLGMVLKACPDIVDYAKGGIANWRDLLATASVVRSMLGISPSAWEQAQAVLGEVPSAIVVACILQRSTAINSAGAYLRGLTRKAEAGEFSLGPMLMAQLNTHRREKKRA